MFDLSIFTTAEGWITLLTLTFLEIVLGIDNIVFITLTSDRLDPRLRSIGRHVGLAGAFLMRAAFLSLAAFLTHLSKPLFEIDVPFFHHGFSVRDIILFLGGGYLIFKGIQEVLELLQLRELKEAFEHTPNEKPHVRKRIGLLRAVVTIMLMDIVFSIDSVITAVGLSDHLFVMIAAVFIAIMIMMIFIDVISDFIETHVEMKILALVFISVIGVLLFLDSLGINSHIEVLGMHVEKLMVYFSMAFALILECIQMRYNVLKNAYLKEHSHDVHSHGLYEESSQHKQKETNSKQE